VVVFQAEGGIRDATVTGVQTCALPISQTLNVAAGANVSSGTAGLIFGTTTISAAGAVIDVAVGGDLTLGSLSGNVSFTKQDSGRSEERRVGKEGRSRAGGGEERRERSR